MFGASIGVTTFLVTSMVVRDHVKDPSFWPVILADVRQQLLTSTETDERAMLEGVVAVLAPIVEQAPDRA